MDDKLFALYKLTVEMSEIRAHLTVAQESIASTNEKIEEKLNVLKILGKEMRNLIAEIQRSKTSRMKEVGMERQQREEE